jgi:hypothetical protein
MRGGVHHVDSGLGDNTGAQSDTRGPRRAPADSSRGRRNRHRSSLFRNRGKSVRSINLIYNDGSCATTTHQGHLNTITHMTVLKALEYRATRYQAKGRLTEDEARSHCWSLDETGTINTAGLESREEIQQQEQIDIRGVSDEVLTVHGTLPGRKEEGITRLLYENANGILNRLGGNEKLEKAKDLIDELGADVVAYNEHRQNLRHRDNRNGWNQLFWGRGGGTLGRGTQRARGGPHWPMPRRRHGSPHVWTAHRIPGYPIMRERRVGPRVVDIYGTQRKRGSPNKDHLRVQPVPEQSSRQ